MTTRGAGQRVTDPNVGFAWQPSSPSTWSSQRTAAKTTPESSAYHRAKQAGRQGIMTTPAVDRYSVLRQASTLLLRANEGWLGRGACMGQQPNYGEQAQGWRSNEGGGGGGGGARELFWGAAVLIAIIALVIKFAAILVGLITAGIAWSIAYWLWRRAKRTAGAGPADGSPPRSSQVLRSISVVFIAIGGLVLAGAISTFLRGSEGESTRPATTDTVAVPSTIAAGTAGSDAEVFVAAGACDVWAADSCDAITRGYATYYTGIWECLRAPESCDVDAYTAPGAARDYMRSFAADFAQRDVRVSSTIDVGYAVVTAVSSLPTGNCGGSQCVTVSSCWWNTAVSNEPATEAYQPLARNFTTTLVQVDGEWRVESDGTESESTDQADCPVP